MAEDRKEGLAAAVALLMPETGQTQGRAEALAALRGEQLALLPSPIAIEDAGADEDGARRAGPGRPPGSRNRSTNEWVDFIAARYRSPLLFLAEAYTRPAQQLAAELGCDRVEAFKLQVKAAETLAPYMHQKQPLAVAISTEGEVTLMLVQPAPAAPAQPGDRAILIENETEGKQ
jgi:hypothetical protein